MKHTDADMSFYYDNPTNSNGEYVEEMIAEGL